MLPAVHIVGNGKRETVVMSVFANTLDSVEIDIVSTVNLNRRSSVQLLAIIFINELCLLLTILLRCYEILFLYKYNFEFIYQINAVKLYYLSIFNL